MATYSLDITINSNKFGSIGNPCKMTHPNDIKSKFPNVTKQALEEYTAVYSSINRDKSLLLGAGKGGVDILVSNDTFSIDLPYEKGIPQTYKFLGMNINQDFQSVIPVGDGYVIVDEMFDRDKIKKLSRSDLDALGYIDNSMILKADDYIDKCSVEIIRKLVTSIKTGELYNIYQKVEARVKNDGRDDKINVADMINLINTINEDLNSTIGLGYDPNIKSVSLNLARVAEEDKQEALSKGSTDDNDASIAAVVIVKCLGYWAKVIKKYTDYNRVLSAIDLWSNVVKKVIGDDAFNKDALTSFNTIVEQSGQFAGGTIAVVGVARNGSISDTDVVRSPVEYALNQMSNTIVGRSNYFTSNILNDIMVSNINIDAFDNPYDLTFSELQAISNYDSLQNIDEDAKVCISSYNLNDSEERGLFLKSAIKSYEKNFREYKPENNYDVTTAMSDLIERGESFKDLLVPEITYNGDVVKGYLTTDTPEMLEIKLTRQNLLKVSKLIGKTLKPVYELF